MTNGFVRQPRQRVLGALFRMGYRSLVSSGKWRSALIEAVAPRVGERVLELCHSTGRVCDDLAALNSGAEISCAQPYGKFEPLPVGIAHIACDQGQLRSAPAAFDKAVCTFAMHYLPASEKFNVLKQLRRVLRPNGILYLLDFDKGRQVVESGFLRAAATQYGAASVAPHLDGSWLTLVTQAGFTSVKQLDSYSATIGRIALFRARRA